MNPVALPTPTPAPKKDAVDPFAGPYSVAIDGLFACQLYTYPLPPLPYDWPEHAFGLNA